MKRYDEADDMLAEIRKITMKINGDNEPAFLDDAVRAAIEAARAKERRAIAGELYSLANTLDSISAQEITRYADAIRSMGGKQ